MFAIGGRVALTLPAPWTAVAVEVDAIQAWPVHDSVTQLSATFIAAFELDDVVALRAAYAPLCDALSAIGRPVWNLVDPLGPIPATTQGMWRVPTPLVLAIVTAWLDTLGATEPVPLAPETAVELVEP